MTADAYAVQGSLQLIGRADRTVKLRGQRVNLDGVEACINAVDGLVGACAVILSPKTGQIVACCTPGVGPVPEPPPVRRVCNFFLSARGCDWGANCRYSHTDESERGLSSAVLRHCTQLLPTYMVPSRCIELPEVLLASG